MGIAGGTMVIYLGIGMDQLTQEVLIINFKPQRTMRNRVPRTRTMRGHRTSKFNRTQNK